MPKTIFPPFNEKYVRVTPRSAEEKCFLHIYGAGIVYQDSRYEFSKTMDTYVFEYIVRGQGFIESGDKRVIVKEGDCVVVAKGKHIHYGSDKKNPYVKMWFSVTGDFIKPLFESYLPKNTDFIVKKANVYPVFEKMLAYLEGNSEDDVRILSKIILEVILTAAGKIQHCEFDDSPIGARIKQYIDNFFLDTRGIKKAAERFGITQRNVVKIFTDEYGITPSKYIKEKKLEYSKELLSHSEKTVSYIAHILGFCDQSYFSTAFYKRYGIYPSKYREEKIAERRKK